MPAPEPAVARLSLLLRSALWRLWLAAALGAALVALWRWAVST